MKIKEKGKKMVEYEEVFSKQRLQQGTEDTLTGFFSVRKTKFGKENFSFRNFGNSGSGMEIEGQSNGIGQVGTRLSEEKSQIGELVEEKPKIGLFTEKKNFVDLREKSQPWSEPKAENRFSFFSDIKTKPNPEVEDNKIEKKGISDFIEDF